MILQKNKIFPTTVTFVITFTLTLVTKLSIGRLRPHFIDVCKPNIDLVECSSKPLYIFDYVCTSGNTYADMSARKSFFSGHSSFSMTTVGFCVFYIQHRLGYVLNSQAVIPFIQMALISAGSIIGFSRIVDHSHHWSDVLIGQFVGIFIAYIIVFKITRMFSKTKIL
uniref:Phosphatidic acid phosphatase type 2/haloperoxidase domain-containing protein n=1 Tax=Panagrolaimus davidi TaxID=227884 RepID=A0A914PA04_9BILA